MLDDVTVARKRITSSTKGGINDTFYWDMEMLHELPKILGNADPMHYAQLLPGVQTCSEYDAGLHIQGCDNAHNFVSLGGVPIYNVSHLLGFFSVFNASHFSQMRFVRSPYEAASPNRLGGTLDMELPQERPERISGEYSIGPMSSQGTFRLPVGKSGGLHVSLRAAYLNLLYGHWLTVDGSELRYGFHDYNLTYTHRATESDRLWLNFYYGGDDVGMKEDNYLTDISLKWQNLAASACWEHTTSRNNKWRHTLYLTTYKNRFNLQQQTLSFALPSHIKTFGYKSGWKGRYFTVGMETAFHHLQPQNPKLEGSYNTAITQTERVQRSGEETVYADFSHTMGEWNLRAGMKGSLYFTSNGKNYFAVDPSASIAKSFGNNGQLRLTYACRHQYLCQTGFSSLGFPTEFWYSSGTYSPPQSAQNVSLAYDVELFDGNYRLSVETYYKRLRHQVEYTGNILDILHTVYQPEELLMVGDGENYGVSLMLDKRTGKLTGWLSYSLGRAFREFGNYRCPASHERIHELNAVATYKIDHRWGIGATMVCASGTPFTAPEHFYLMDKQLVSQFGPHNANRLKPYCRLDVSVNYNLKKQGNRESGLNLSLYNVTCRKNDIFYRLKLYEGEFAYRPMRFLLRILPSISYFHKF